MRVEAFTGYLEAASQLVGRRLELLRELTGGEHALTLLVTDGRAEYVVRRFPANDPAVGREVAVLARLEPTAGLAPRLIAYSEEPTSPTIVTGRVPGGHPARNLSASTMASQMAAALARIHRLDGHGLPTAPQHPPSGAGPASAAARAQFDDLDRSGPVLTHYDFWCGNALWRGATLTGVVDWSGARHAPRGVDVAWCRQDLVLLGHSEAADLFLREYENWSEQPISQISAWDLQAAAQAEDSVEEWAPNYHAIGRTHLTATVLRERPTRWTTHLLETEGRR
jgi:aminoglycoside phosphotransferase (APT) family kinase protein